MRILFWVTLTICLIVVLVVYGGVPVEALPAIAAVVGGAVALGLGLRRWLDRSELRSLRRALQADPEDAFDVSSYRTRYSGSVSKVTTLAASDIKLILYDVKQGGMWLLKRLGLSRRLDIDDRSFNDEIYVDGDAAAGSVLFASPDTRGAAREIFRLRFSSIQWRSGLISAVRTGKIPCDAASAVRPYLRLLAEVPVKDDPRHRVHQVNPKEAKN